MSAQFVQCLVPSLAGGDVVTDESSLSSTAEEEEEAVAVAPFPTLVAAHEGHLSASPGTDFNNFDLLRLMAGDTAGVALTRIGINSRLVFSEPALQVKFTVPPDSERPALFRSRVLNFPLASNLQGEKKQEGGSSLRGQVAPVRGPRGNIRGDDSGVLAVRLRVLRRGQRRRGSRRRTQWRRRVRRLRAAVLRSAAHDCRRLRDRVEGAVDVVVRSDRSWVGSLEILRLGLI